MNMTATQAQATCPLPKSYLPEAEKEGLNQNMIYLMASYTVGMVVDDRAGETVACVCGHAKTCDGISEIQGVCH